MTTITLWIAASTLVGLVAGRCIHAGMSELQPQDRSETVAQPH